jgi:uncharacterized protein with FMN-binding domain
MVDLDESTRVRATRQALTAGAAGALTFAFALQSGTALAAAKVYKGPSVAEQFGPVQVTIYVTGKKITNVKATVHTSDPASTAIANHALPVLKKEVLKAQSAKIHAVSGATEISKAYIKSLKGALKKAHM